jgi:NCAIR mutase (PurE)-related protein
MTSNKQLHDLLDQVARGELDADTAHLRLLSARARHTKIWGLRASIITARPAGVSGRLRLGQTPAQIAGIAAKSSTRLVSTALAPAAAFEAVRQTIPAATSTPKRPSSAAAAGRHARQGMIVVAATGTSDISVAEEAACGGAHGQ